MKKEKGITLVALVITIVIIVILSSVTITATFGDNGIIKKAELARDLASNSTIKENEDMNSLMDEYANIMSEGSEVPEPPKDTTSPIVSIVVGEITETSIAITVNAEDKESGMVENPKYTYYIKKSTEEDSAYQEKATDVTEKNYTFTSLTQETNYSIKVVVKSDKAGNVGQGTTQASTTKPREPTVEEKLKEGDYVNYVDGKGQTRKCVVLYDNTSGYGIQVITMDTVENVTLGSINFTTSMNSYNSVINILNSKAEEYNNSTYSSDARCVGSVPNNKNSESGMHKTQFGGTYDGKLRDTDTNYETDYNKMKTMKGQIQNIGKSYWLASRIVISVSDSSGFYVRIYSGGLDRNCLCDVNSYYGFTKGYSKLDGFRPVFILKSGIKVTGGDGSESSPYTLGV